MQYSYQLSSSFSNPTINRKIQVQGQVLFYADAQRVDKKTMYRSLYHKKLVTSVLIDTLNGYSSYEI